MKTIVVTQHELNQATRPNVYRNKKVYTRKSKHRGDHQGNSDRQSYFVYSIKLKDKIYEKTINIREN
jgi:hypothetical protein